MRHRRIACKNKIKHKTRNNAYSSLQHVIRLGFIACVYKCRKCGYWHVGKPSYYDSPSHFWANIENKIKRHNNY